MKTQTISQTQILDNINYFRNNITNNRTHFKNNKGIYYMFFDKFNQSYLLECPIEHINTDNKKIEYNKFFLYTIPNKTTNKNEGMIGYLSFELYNNTATLLRLQITNQNYLRKKIGSNLLHFFEYFARSNNYNFAIGTIAEMTAEKKL